MSFRMPAPLRAQILHWVQSDAEAASFLVTLWEISQVWDDVVDGDGESRPHHISRAIGGALLLRHRNRFYRAHQDQIDPVLSAWVLGWETANRLEAGRDCLEMAYTLRSLWLLVVAECARIVGGDAWALRVSVDAWENSHAAEDFETYAAELDNEITEKGDA